MKDKQEFYEDIYKRARPMLESRLSEYRLLHSISVSNTAAMMAKRYNIDVGKARLAGLLHDWDKNYNDEQLFKRVVDFGIEVGWRIEDMGSILHALTGAEAVKREFPELSSDIIQAIARHTTGAVNMSELDIIIYVADMIEPLRSQGNLTPLRVAVGKIPLDELFLKSFEVSMRHLIKRHRFIHPESLEVWNAYVAKERSKNPAKVELETRRFSGSQ